MPTPRTRTRTKRPAPAKTPNWFTYFPDDYRWSAAICGMLSNAQWGSADLGEIDQEFARGVGQGLVSSGEREQPARQTVAKNGAHNRARPISSSTTMSSTQP